MTIDERIAAELRRHVPEVDEHAAWDRIRSQAPVHRRSRAARLVAVPVAAAAFLLVGSILVSTLSSGPEPGGDPQSPLLGTWVFIDGDGSTQTMVLEASGDEAVEMLVHDDFASVCSGAPSTMTGTGGFQGDNELVFPSPELTCDDGSQPEALSGSPLEEQLRNFTLVLDPEADTLTDNFGLEWTREDATREDAEAGGMWPQSSLEEVQEAQELADAGDPDYTWQVNGEIANGNAPNAEIVARFIREELGWEEFIFNGEVGGEYPDIGLTYMKCAPGETNPIYPEDEYAGECAPTIDDLQYETVIIDLAQPVRSDPTGIWVVSGWTMGAPFAQSDPGPVQAAAIALLEEFLEARVAGEGAEGYVDVRQHPVFGTLDEIPLLYSTSSGAPYERYEIDVVGGPHWPYGDLEFDVRLFADGGETVVEQPFNWSDSRLDHDVTETKENGQPVGVPFAFFDGEVLLTAAKPWVGGFERNSLDLGDRLHLRDQEAIVLVGDPLPVATGCAIGPTPADADALARSLESDPDLQVTRPVAVSVGGIDALTMDIVFASEADDCDAVLRLRDDPSTRRWGLLDRGSHMRLYLFDMPEGSSMRILAIAIVAPEARFDAVIEAATPVMDSIEFIGQ
ncbi:MAG TPA: hypothetical protein VJQ79_13670 [Acidimicrobiia bacterium]|nr:hypothetical protein [Acidimicrobiia bacterium]